MIVIMLRDENFGVLDKSQFGTTQIVRGAITSGELDIYPEYTGNGAFFFSQADDPVWKDAQRGFEKVKLLDQQNNIVWLTPAPANNTWAIAIPKTLSDRENLRTMDDFAAYVNRGGRVRLIGSEEFVTSEAALPSFQKAYGFTLKQEQLLVVQSGDTAQTEKAASEGTDGINAAMAYGTDGGLNAFGLVVLTDTKGVQPVYAPAPIVRREVFEKYPEIETILKPVFESLDLETLQRLNARIAVDGESPTDVARSYLKEKGFIQ
jgi:osmoprotectant transport system substrate-binding protein